jgi:hypothetical protein
MKVPAGSIPHSGDIGGLGILGMGAKSGQCGIFRRNRRLRDAGKLHADQGRSDDVIGVTEPL